MSCLSPSQRRKFKCKMKNTKDHNSRGREIKELSGLGSPSDGKGIVNRVWGIVIFHFLSSFSIPYTPPVRLLRLRPRNDRGKREK